MDKVQCFLDKTAVLRSELDKRYNLINKYDDLLDYLKSFESIDELR